MLEITKILNQTANSSKFTFAKLKVQNLSHQQIDEYVKQHEGKPILCVTTVTELSGEVTPPSIKLLAFWIMGTLQICHHTQSAILWSIIILSHPRIHTHVFTKTHTHTTMLLAHNCYHLFFSRQKCSICNHCENGVRGRTGSYCNNTLLHPWK